MSKPKHTHGPWKVDDTWGLIVSNDGAEIAACHSGIAANARLIAAAPDLLAALHAAAVILRTTAPGHNVTLVQVEAAIAKAEGRD